MKGGSLATLMPPVSTGSSAWVSPWLGHWWHRPVATPKVPLDSSCQPRCCLVFPLVLVFVLVCQVGQGITKLKTNPGRRKRGEDACHRSPCIFLVRFIMYLCKGWGCGQREWEGRAFLPRQSGLCPCRSLSCALVWC